MPARATLALTTWQIVTTFAARSDGFAIPVQLDGNAGATLQPVRQQPSRARAGRAFDGNAATASLGGLGVLRSVAGELETLPLAWHSSDSVQSHDSVRDGEVHACKQLTSAMWAVVIRGNFSELLDTWPDVARLSRFCKLFVHTRSFTFRTHVRQRSDFMPMCC